MGPQDNTDAASHRLSLPAGSDQKEVSVTSYWNQDLSRAGQSRMDKAPPSQTEGWGVEVHFAYTGQGLSTLYLPPSLPLTQSPPTLPPSLSPRLSRAFTSCHRVPSVIFSCEESVFPASLRGPQAQGPTESPPTPLPAPDSNFCVPCDLNKAFEVSGMWFLEQLGQNAI